MKQHPADMLIVCGRSIIIHILWKQISGMGSRKMRIHFFRSTNPKTKTLSLNSQSHQCIVSLHQMKGNVKYFANSLL